jgi:sialic acid synthase SpsE
MLTLKNPGTGLAARHMSEVVGRKAKVLIPADTLIDLTMVEPG